MLKTRTKGPGGGQAIWALGCMSGTSLDGVDGALVLTDGERVEEFGPSVFLPFDDAEQAQLRAVLGAWPGEEGVAEAAELVETSHAILVSKLSSHHIDIIGFHGQTLAHDPRGRGTHQVGDGQVLAEISGRPVVWDFRSADVLLGGEGAPLAPFYHHALARHIKADMPLVFLNLGGVGNVTWVDPNVADPAATGACLAFDTGPANAPINDVMRARRGQSFDAGGALALSGEVREEIVDQFLQHPYFLRIPPKSLDRDAFSSLKDQVEMLCDADAVATLSACVAAAVARGLEHCPSTPSRILVTGGGRHNAAIMQELRARCGGDVLPVEEAGLDGDMLEAQAFAYLAVRVARGLPTSCPATTGVEAAVGGGVLSYPQGGGDQDR
ncbi:anhydro-N-acetylmuramic acid kinase [Aliiroseovarius crassostreae]|uniref:anhydro-N-acetylmuramic acid kinase n=1 Tax=Aliiroseovarius crassostreae TaxID=154981 RepID=UPI0021AFFDC2|nr:anhydro-N-acetylmuramic acid kinase [Aliiroseovarius crassostreae]UWQ09020.1 anhydro-N-acetylmuramic acid kinase [Aliiroseovarius crassostreae]UWQ12099.1 anhydro-N-acetylmuramic acid kinase [Aliiroseovarius crassostreae]